MLLIDNNLSPRLVKFLAEVFPGLMHVEDVMLGEAEDQVIWQYAAQNKLDILTKDADFNDIQRLRSYPPKIVWIRSGNISTSMVVQLLLDQASDIHRFLADPDLGVLEIQ